MGGGRRWEGKVESIHVYVAPKPGGLIHPPSQILKGVVECLGGTQVEVTEVREQQYKYLQVSTCNKAVLEQRRDLFWPQDSRLPKESCPRGKEML